MFKRKKETSEQTQERMRKELRKEKLKIHYSTRKNVERIADSLESIACQMAAINIQQDQQKQVVTGLSSICKNTFNENMRTQEILDLIKQLFPEEQKV